MSDDEYLIIACPACDSGIKKSNITIKKIPQAVLGRCEFGKDNYNLNVRQSDTVDDWEDSTLEDFEQFDEPADERKEKYPSNGNKQLSLDFNG